ncbi:hypothetical protein B0T16DRAFT_108402 [Cercophora newfieldiana]|uniref:Uncharacterized protein n=1 Tax=Cercophora newfieldiana TaxID=92897 RepID=A0AA40CW83_9PEZI|nr:hypothetical protein B0T16DRAFT_108402 [Cercophora newfieldiana]
MKASGDMSSMRVPHTFVSCPLFALWFGSYQPLKWLPVFCKVPVATLNRTLRQVPGLICRREIWGDGGFLQCSFWPVPRVMPLLAAGESSKWLTRAPFSSILLANLANSRYRRTVSRFGVSLEPRDQKKKKRDFSQQKRPFDTPGTCPLWLAVWEAPLDFRGTRGWHGWAADGPGGLLSAGLFVPSAPADPLHFSQGCPSESRASEWTTVKMHRLDPRHLSDAHSAPSRMHLPIAVLVSCLSGYSLRFGRSTDQSQACQVGPRGEAQRASERPRRR